MYILKHLWQRWAVGTLAVVMLAGVYLFQRVDFSIWIADLSPNLKFIVNKSARFVLNDLACVMLIIAFFNKSKYVRLSVAVFLLELLLLLPVYFVLKLSLEGTSEISSPLLSQLHRMIVNPLLMLILIVGLFYQDYYWKKPDL